MTEVEKEMSDKAAIDAMRNAKSNMERALSRIEMLERVIGKVKSDVGILKGYIAPNVYIYHNGQSSGSSKSCTSLADDVIALCAKVLS